MASRELRIAFFCKISTFCLFQESGKKLESISQKQVNDSFFYSLNKNQLRDLSLLLSKVVLLMPHLKHLSLLGNLACPHPIFSSSQENYARYLLNFFVAFSQKKTNTLLKTKKRRNPSTNSTPLIGFELKVRRSDVKLGQQNFGVSIAKTSANY